MGDPNVFYTRIDFKKTMNTVHLIDLLIPLFFRRRMELQNPGMRSFASQIPMNESVVGIKGECPKKLAKFFIILIASSYPISEDIRNHTLVFVRI
jgi:hypothetical protein